MKVFVLNYLIDPCDEMSSDCVIGVFGNAEAAKAAMKDEFADTLVDVMEAYDTDNRESLEKESDVNIAELDYECSVYYAGNYREYKITSWDVEDAASSSNDRSLAMRQMEQELIEIVREHGDDILPLEDLGMSWTEECDGECYTKDITDISIERTWDGDTVLNVCINGIDRIPYSDCDHDDLGHNLADYIYNEIKTYY